MTASFPVRSTSKDGEIMRLLVAEDEVKINNIISKRLRKEGYSVDSCFDGEEALHFLSVGEFDAVILDIMMPKKDGLTVLREMRSKNNNTPVYSSPRKTPYPTGWKGSTPGRRTIL